MYQLAAQYITENQNVNFHRIRDLSASGIDEYLSRKKGHLLLRERLSLLFVHNKNFDELQQFRKQSSYSHSRSYSILVEFNRLFMNYLSSAYSLREHLKTGITRDFGRKSEHFLNYNDILGKIEEQYPTYAFYQDFRNFVQHCGFPVGKANSKEDIYGTRLDLTYSRRKLLEDYNRWDKSSLDSWACDIIDLTEITQDHQEIILREFPVIILEIYGNEVDATEFYYRSLHDEAKAVDKDAKAVIITKSNRTEKGGEVTFEQVPTDSLGELGLNPVNQ